MKTQPTPYKNNTTTEQRIKSVKDKQGRRWIIVETVTSRWYSENYFARVLQHPETADDLAKIALPTEEVTE
jgi:hypothetical protein